MILFPSIFVGGTFARTVDAACFVMNIPVYDYGFQPLYNAFIAAHNAPKHVNKVTVSGTESRQNIVITNTKAGRSPFKYEDHALQV